MRSFWLSWLVVVGCTREELVLFAPADVALGSTVSGKLELRECEGGGGGHDSPPPQCELTTVPLRSVRIDRTDVFELAPTDTGFTYKAIAVGTAVLDAVADDDDGTTFTRPLRSAVPDRVEVSLACGASRAFGTNTEVQTSFRLYAGTKYLHYGDGVFPLESSMLLLQAEKTAANNGRAYYTTPATPGIATITSRFDPALDAQIHVFSVSEVTRIGIADHSTKPVSPVPLGGTRRFSGTFVLVGNNQHTCGDAYPRTLRVLTPATCAIWDGAQDRSTLQLVGDRHEFHLRGLALGDCTVSLSLDGTAHVVQKTFGVVPEG